MMNEIRQMIENGESETAVAFANTKGGVILIGVSDKGEIKGVQIGRSTLKNGANQISQSTEPSIIPDILDNVIDKKHVVVIRIPEFPIKPASVKGRCLRRVGNSNRAMTPQEIAQIHLHSTGVSWDKLPVSDASLKDIDLEKVKRYITRANETSRRKIQEDENPSQVLEKLELIKEGKPTWAAILLFHKHPQRFLSRRV